MKRIIPYVIGFLIVFLSLIPPVDDLTIKAPITSWPWFVLISGFFGFYICIFKIPLAVKIISVLGFINCFFSAIPYVSFTSYISFVFCCYFYIICLYADDLIAVFKILQTILLFNVFIFFMQIIKRDILLNFGLENVLCFGITGQHMQSASFSIILSASVLFMSPFNFLFPGFVSVLCNSTGAFFAFSGGLISYLYFYNFKKYLLVISVLCLLIFIFWGNYSHKFEHNLAKQYGRLAVWKKTLELANERPVFGWGISSYQHLFPSLSWNYSRPWNRAHNCWIQILFEMGYSGFLVIAAYVSYLYFRLIKAINIHAFKKDAICGLSGLTMIILDMMIHFPTRQIGCVLIIIFLLAYCQRTVNLCLYQK